MWLDTIFLVCKRVQKTKVDMQINDPDVYIPDWKVCKMQGGGSMKYNRKYIEDIKTAGVGGDIPCAGQTFHSGIYTGFVACYTAMS